MVFGPELHHKQQQWYLCARLRSKALAALQQGWAQVQEPRHTKEAYEEHPWALFAAWRSGGVAVRTKLHGAAWAVATYSL